MTNTHTPGSLTAGLLARLMEHRDRLDGDVQAAYGELLDILALGTRTGDSVFAQSARILRAEARVAVADTAVTLVQSGASEQEAADHLARAFATAEPIPAADLARMTTREGYRHELNSLEELFFGLRP